MTKKSKKGIEVLSYLVKVFEKNEKNKANAEEKNAFENWTPNIDTFVQNDTDNENLTQINNEIWNRLVAKHRLDKQNSKTRFVLRPLYQRIAVAVAIAVFIVGTAWFSFYTFAPSTTDSETILAHKTWNSTDTERLIVKLPDGSTVKINAGTQLEIAEAEFNKQKREVWLNGEAFFDVAKNPEKPFIIHTGEMTTEVKGTSFNIKAYDELNERVVTVKTGRVQVSLNDKIVATLTPNEQLTYDLNNNTETVLTTQWNNACGWMDSRLVLERANISELKLRIRQTFGKELVVKGNTLDNILITSSFHQNATITQVMDIISAMYGLKYTITESKVIINN